MEDGVGGILLPWKGTTFNSTKVSKHISHIILKSIGMVSQDEEDNLDETEDFNDPVDATDSTDTRHHPEDPP